jgi:hypothetical protein
VSITVLCGEKAMVSSNLEKQPFETPVLRLYSPMNQDTDIRIGKKLYFQTKMVLADTAKTSDEDMVNRHEKIK